MSTQSRLRGSRGTPVRRMRGRASVRLGSVSSLDPAGETFTGLIPRPRDPGEYTVWARTCFGLADSPTCVRGAAGVTL